MNSYNLKRIKVSDLTPGDLFIWDYELNDVRSTRQCVKMLLSTTKATPFNVHYEINYLSWTDDPKDDRFAGWIVFNKPRSSSLDVYVL